LSVAALVLTLAFLDIELLRDLRSPLLLLLVEGLRWRRSWWRWNFFWLERLRLALGADLGLLLLLLECLTRRWLDTVALGLRPLGDLDLPLVAWASAAC